MGEGSFKHIYSFFQLPHGKMGKPEKKQIRGCVMGIKPHRRFGKFNGLLRAACIDQNPGHDPVGSVVVGVKGDGPIGLADCLVIVPPK